jgi:hypothetical protein
MATCTRNELVAQAAAKVGILGVGQALSDEDFELIDDYVDKLFDQLAEDEIWTVADEEEIPASLCPYLATLLANLCAAEYGSAFSGQVKMEHEAILRRLVRQKETFEIQQVDYF